MATDSKRLKNAREAVILHRLRGNKNIEDVSAETGISASSIKNYETGENSPSLNALTKLLPVYDLCVEDVLELLGVGDLMNKDAAYNRSENHKKRLQVFEGQSYQCCFFSNSGSGEFVSLEVGPFKFCDDGYSQAKAHASGYAYDCKATVTDSGLFAIMSFVSSDILDDRAFFVIPYDSGIKNRFDVGLGAMLSLAKKDAHRQVPAFQLVAVISKQYLGDIGGIERFKDLCKEKLTLPKAQENGYTMHLDGIHTLSYQLYEEVEKLVKNRQ